MLEIRVASVMHALADPTRRDIYERVVKAGETTVAELARTGAVSQPAISQHIEQLRCRLGPEGAAGLTMGLDAYYKNTRDQIDDGQFGAATPGNAFVLNHLPQSLSKQMRRTQKRPAQFRQAGLLSLCPPGRDRFRSAQITTQTRTTSSGGASRAAPASAPAVPWTPDSGRSGWQGIACHQPRRSWVER
jgi:DNA-binding transcriptional ArsR family regulator